MNFIQSQYNKLNQHKFNQQTTNRKKIMAGPDTEEFILIDVNDNNGKVQQAVMFANAQLTHSIIKQSTQNLAGSTTHSVDGWSEITAPSVHSINSTQKQGQGMMIFIAIFPLLFPQQIDSIERVLLYISTILYIAVKESGSTFSIFSGTFLHNPAPMIPNQAEGSDKGYYLINPSASQENTEGPMLSSYDVSTENEEGSNHNQMPNMPLPSSLSSIPDPPNNIERHSIGSVGSRVPFSWAEVTKIQPAFHNDPDNGPKVFNQTPKIRTRYRRKGKDNGIKPNNSNSPRPPPPSAQTDNTRINNEDYPMAAIPECDPYATKADLGRRVRRSGKRGSRLKYPNGRRGGKKNWRKKNQSK